MLKEYQVSTPSIDWCVDVSVPVCYEVMFLVCLGSVFSRRYLFSLYLPMDCRCKQAYT